jgi:ABC-2 type transport system ATP-binding protein
MIKIENLSYKYNKEPVLKNLSLNINRGETLLISGINGAGKTTLLRLIAGVLLPQQGNIHFSPELGKNPLEKIGFFSDQMRLYENLTLESSIDLHSSIYNIKSFDLDLLHRLKLDLNKKISELSAGQKVIFCLSLILNANPEILLIDEVIHSIDAFLREIFLEKVLELIEERKITLVLVNLNYHDIEKIPQRLVLIKDGAIEVDEPIEDLKTKVKKVVTREKISHLPVLHSRKFSDSFEYYLYPFESGFEDQIEGKIIDLNLDEIVKAFIGGDYA